MGGGRSLQVALAECPLRAMTAAITFAVCLLATSAGFAQDATPELSSQETQPSFHVESRRNLVLVRVVVRNSKGEAVQSLHKQDFEVFDNGKQQDIIEFDAQSLEGQSTKNAAASPTNAALPPEFQEEDSNRAFRYVGLFFDDVHADFEGLTRCVQAAQHYLDAYPKSGPESGAKSADRIGVFTASGQVMLDFTADLDKVREQLRRIQPRPIVPREINPCPDIFPYQAYLIIDRHDEQATETAAQEILACQYHDDTNYLTQARSEVLGEAIKIQTRDETQSDYTYRVLEQLVKRLAALPGERSIVFISPGFFAYEKELRLSEITDRAVRARVTISALDSKGLDAGVPGEDISKQGIFLPYAPGLMGAKLKDEVSSRSYDEEVLSEFAYDTGGVLFHNNNDLDQGFRRVAARPEASYVLAFSPETLKPDGRFHTLKVKLVLKGDYALQARRGYFAPVKEDAKGTEAHNEIEEAIFSQDALSGMPMDVQTQYFMLSQKQARLSVRAHLDLKALRFRKEQGRNFNKLTIVTALFDRDGKYMSAKEKTLEFHLLDQNLERLSRTGLDTRASFDVGPGTYMVREVVHEVEDGRICGLSRTVEIPYSN